MYTAKILKRLTYILISHEYFGVVMFVWGFFTFGIQHVVLHFFNMATRGAENPSTKTQ